MEDGSKYNWAGTPCVTALTLIPRRFSQTCTRENVIFQSFKICRWFSESLKLRASVRTFLFYSKMVLLLKPRCLQPARCAGASTASAHSCGHDGGHNRHHAFVKLPLKGILKYLIYLFLPTVRQLNPTHFLFSFPLGFPNAFFTLPFLIPASSATKWERSIRRREKT